MRHYAPRILVSFLILLGALAGAEFLLRMRLGPPPAEAPWADYDDMYSEINKNLYSLTLNKDWTFSYKAVRPHSEPRKFLARKPPGVVRIFIVGGSVARLYVGRELVRFEKYFDASFPGTRFQIISAGMATYDSYRDALVQREILSYQPDAIILMSGNNEFFDPETSNPALYHLTKRLRALWLFRIPIDRLRAERRPHVTTLEERRASFEKNLRAMAARAKKKNVMMIFCTLPANIRDVPPMRSRPPLDDPDYLRARAALDSGNDQAALAKFESCVRDHPLEPFGHYWLAKILDRRKLYQEAAAHYRRAVDLDDPGERCASERNEIIRRVAGENGMILADLQKEFEEISEDHIPGNRIFKDNVHWKQEYYGLVSLTILRSIYDAARSGGSFLSPAGRWNWGWLASEDASIRRPVVGRESAELYGDEEIFAGMFGAAGAGDGLSEASLAFFESAVRSDPKRVDFLARSFVNTEPALERINWAKEHAGELRNGWANIQVHVGETYRRRRDYRKALEYFDESLRFDPGRGQALLQKALTLFSLGRTAEARACLDKISDPSRRFPEFPYWASVIRGQ